MSDRGRPFASNALQAKALEAESSARAVIAQGDRTTRSWVRLAIALRALHRWDELESALQEADRAARNARDFAQLGELLTQLERYDPACAAYDRALTQDPDNPRLLFNRATVRRFLGKLAAAEEDYDRLLRIDPSDVEAWGNRSELRTQTAERNHVDGLQRRLRAGFKSPVSEVPIRFALAKEYEDLGRYEQSWSELCIGAAIRRRHLEYDIRQDLQTVEWIIEAYPHASQRSDGSPSAEPIFILGMPRTGSTLLERIMTGNPCVHSAGELVDFAAALVQSVNRDKVGPPLSRRELIAASAGLNFEELGEAYLARTRPRTDHSPRFIDKMPLNYLYCGIIARALPNARMLHLTRHPMATCYAIFKTLFGRGYPFSYDLDEIADYYIGYHRLMQHWHQSMPQAVLDVSYEKLVAMPTVEARAAFDFCSLEWQDGYLDISQRTTASTTASAAQVRRSIYSTSIDLWRHYEGALAPVAERLRRAGIDVT